MGTILIIAILAVFSLCFLLRSFGIFLHYKRHEAALKSDTSLHYGIWAAVFTGLIACFTSHWLLFFIAEGGLVLGTSLYKCCRYKNNDSKLEKAICWTFMFLVLWTMAAYVTGKIV